MCPTLTLIAVCIALTTSTTVRAQGLPMQDSATRAAMIGAATKMNQPADFVLGHREELALSAEQVSKLNALARAMRDSAGVRKAHMLSQMKARKPMPATMAAAGWTGPIDEKALRVEMCQNSERSVEISLAMAYDRRAVAALLTSEQVTKLPQLQSADMMKVMKLMKR